MNEMFSKTENRGNGAHYSLKVIMGSWDKDDKNRTAINEATNIRQRAQDSQVSQRVSFQVKIQSKIQQQTSKNF